MAINHQLGNGFSGASASLSSSGEILNPIEYFNLSLTESSPNSFATQFIIPKEATGESKDTIVFYITSSGQRPLVGIGTDTPQTSFDVKEQLDNSTGVELLIRNSRTATKGADPGDAAGTINFIIDSGSYNNIQTSGSIAKITTEVLNVTDEGAIGDLLLQTAQTEKEEPITIMRMGHNGSSLTSSLDVSLFLKAQKIALGTVNEGNVSSGGIGMSGDLNVLGNTSLGNQLSDTHEFNGSITASNDISASGDITGSDVYINDWGSVSASLAAASGGGGAVSTYTNGANNRIITSTGASGINGESTLTYDGSIFELQASEFNIQSSTFNFNGVPAGTDNTVLVLNSSNDIVRDEIDSRVWGTSLVDTSGTPANNQIAVFTDSNTIEGTSEFTFGGGALVVEGGGITIFNNAQDDAAFQIKGSSDSNLLQVNPQANDRIGIGTAAPDDKLGIVGGISLTGDISGNGSTLKVSEIASSIGAAASAGDKGLNAETITFYSNTVVAGAVYYLGSSAWALSDADAESTSKGFMGVATSTNSNTGMVIHGIVYVGNDPGGSVGDIVYLSTADGRLTNDVSAFTANDIVRVMGYKVGTNLVFFDPSKDWIEIS